MAGIHGEGLIYDPAEDAVVQVMHVLDDHIRSVVTHGDVMHVHGRDCRRKRDRGCGKKNLECVQLPAHVSLLMAFQALPDLVNQYTVSAHIDKVETQLSFINVFNTITLQ
jgi:hypothetical protein